MSIDSTITRLKRELCTPEEFFREFQGANICVPLHQINGATENATGLWVFQSGDQHCGGVFTNPQYMTGVVDAAHWVAITGRELASQWPSDLAMSINPGTSAPQLLVPAKEVKRMTRDDLGYVLPAGSKFAVGAPAMPPSREIQDATEELLNIFPEIESGYIFQISDGDGSRLALGLSISSNRRDDNILPLVVEWMTTRLPRNLGIDILPLTRTLQASVSQYAEPIRKRT